MAKKKSNLPQHVLEELANIRSDLTSYEEVLSFDKTIKGVQLPVDQDSMWGKMETGKNDPSYWPNEDAWMDYHWKTMPKTNPEEWLEMMESAKTEDIKAWQAEYPDWFDTKKNPLAKQAVLPEEVSYDSDEASNSKRVSNSSGGGGSSPPPRGHGIQGDGSFVPGGPGQIPDPLPSDAPNDLTGDSFLEAVRLFAKAVDKFSEGMDKDMDQKERRVPTARRGGAGPWIAAALRAFETI